MTRDGRTRTLGWRGIDPLRVEGARVNLDADGLSAWGTSTAPDYVLDWMLETGPGWITRRLSVRARGDAWVRSLELDRDDVGTWSARRREGSHPSPAAELDVSGLDDALDCDLALCPFTNTMPVLRHDLVAAAQRGESASVEFVMAWIDVPALTLEPSPQRYTALGPAPDGGALIRFVSEDFETVIEFDDDGLVRDYPDLAARLLVA